MLYFLGYCQVLFCKVGVDHDSFVFPYPKDDGVSYIGDGDAFQNGLLCNVFWMHIMGSCPCRCCRMQDLMLSRKDSSSWWNS